LDPMECKCETVFCSKCIGTWLRNNPHCPSCREPLRQEQLKRAHRSVRAYLDALLVRCQQPGCGWTGALDARAGHECLRGRVAQLEADVARKDLLLREAVKLQEETDGQLEMARNQANRLVLMAENLMEMAEGRGCVTLSKARAKEKTEAEVALPGEKVQEVKAKCQTLTAEMQVMRAM